MNNNKKFITAIVLIIAVSFFLTACAPKAQEPLSTEQTSDMPVAAAYSTVTIDINPSIQLKVQDGLVSEVKAYNDDGTEILADYPVSGLNVKEAVSIILTSFVDEGYITYGDKAAILVTVTGESVEDIEDAIEEAAEEALKEKDLDIELIMADVDDATSNEAASSGYSTGRFILLNYIADMEGITFEEAAAAYGSMNINELLDLFEDAEDYLEDHFKYDDEDYDDDSDDDEDYDDDYDDDEDYDDDSYDDDSYDDESYDDDDDDDSYDDESDDDESDDDDDSYDDDDDEEDDD